MKKSVQLSYVLAIGMAFSSCAKVNYDKRRNAKQISAQTLKAQPDQLQTVEIAEGETKKISLTVKDGQGPTTQDMKIKWQITAQDASKVDVKKRFQATEGVIDLKAGSTSLEINLTAAMPDEEQQGDQLFLISMVNEAGKTKQAILKLIDVKLEKKSEDTPPVNDTTTTTDEQNTDVKVALKETEVSLKADAAGEVTLALDQASKEDVLVEIDSQDNTAIAGKDYLSLKQAVSIPAGQKEAKIQIVVLSKACDQAKDFTVKITKANGAQVTSDSAKINLATDSKVKCEDSSTESKKKD